MSTSIAEQNAHSTYEIIERDNLEERHIIGILVDNEFGVLSRVIGLFSSRGYNINSLTVSEVDVERNLSRITIATTGTPAVITQILALLDRLVPVHEVRDLTMDSPHIERTLGLVKVITQTSEARSEAQKIADRFGARTIDSTTESFIFELSDTSDNLNHFIDVLTPYGVKEICRTGITAIARGKDRMGMALSEL